MLLVNMMLQVQEVPAMKILQMMLLNLSRNHIQKMPSQPDQVPFLKMKRPKDYQLKVMQKKKMIPQKDPSKKMMIVLNP